MVVLPNVIPVTPPAVSIVATPVALLLHVPPPVASLNVVVIPKQASGPPVIAAGSGFTTSVPVI